MKVRTSSLTPRGCKYLGEILPNLQCLESLNVSANNGIGPGGAVELIKSLPLSVTDLNMSSTGIGKEDCKALRDMLASSNYQIKYPHISYNCLKVLNM